MGNAQIVYEARFNQAESYILFHKNIAEGQRNMLKMWKLNVKC